MNRPHSNPTLQTPQAGAPICNRLYRTIHQTAASRYSKLCAALLFFLLVSTATRVCASWDYGNGRHGTFVLTTNATIEQLYQTVRLASDPLEYNSEDTNAVPHFRKFTITNNAVLSATAWDGSRGGAVVLKVQGLLLVTTGSRISVSALGYRGGNAFRQGESYAGTPAVGTSANYGGGGASQYDYDGSGGGGYGSAGAAGVGGRESGKGGGTYGEASLSVVYRGSGGGGAPPGNNPNPTGGNGGGIIVLTVGRLSVMGRLQSDGGVGQRGRGGAGGGSGGSILLRVVSAELGGEYVSANGGGSYNPDTGGQGGAGRVRVESAHPIIGQTSPLASVFLSPNADSDGDSIPDVIECPAGGNPPPDSDSDGIPDYLEFDSDNDGIPDAIERGPDGNSPRDSDDDGLSDYRDTDSDDDGIPDAVERGPSGESPRDSDADGLPDYRDRDSDNNGIPDAVELGPDGKRLSQDTDGDGIPDFWETFYHTNPTNALDSTMHPPGDQLIYLLKYLFGLNPFTPDTDGDGLSDYDELFVYGTNPLLADTDGDGMPDAWEVSNGLNPRLNDANGDLDLDAVSNLQEYQNRALGYRPNQADSLGDGLSDYERFVGSQTNRFYYDRNNRLIGADYNRGSNGLAIAYVYDGNGNLLRQKNLVRDANHNGLPDVWEFLNSLTNNASAYADTDGDGWTDAQEWKSGTNPRDAASKPGLLGNPGLNIASLQLPFTPSNFVVGVGQLDGLGAEEIVIGADGNPGTNTNFLLVLTQGPTSWQTQRVEVGTFGINSIAVGRPANRPSVGVFVGLRDTNGGGWIMEFTSNGGVWQSNLIALSTSETAFVGGIRQSGDLLANLARNGISGALWRLAFSNAAWNVTLISSNASHRGILSHGPVFSRTARDSSLRLLDVGGIEAMGGSAESYKDDILLPSGFVINPATGKWHIMTPGAMTWSGASNYFASFHGAVALPMSAQENAWFSSLESQEAWIGLYWVREGTAYEPAIPYFADGTVAPHSGNAPYYSGFGYWMSRSGEHSAPYPMPNFTTINYGNNTLVYGGLQIWGTRGGGVTFPGIGEVLPPVVILTNQWLIPEPAATIRFPLRGLSLVVGLPHPNQTNSSSLFYLYGDDRNRSGKLDGNDTFVLTEYLVSGNTCTTNTLFQVPIASDNVAQSFSLAAVNFTDTGRDILFTGEPDGRVYSWTGVDATSPLQRQLFSDAWVSGAWQAMCGLQTPALGKSLVGLMVDPTTQNICSVICWAPQAVLPTPQPSLIETAPLASVLPQSGDSGTLMSIQIRLWDAEGNTSTPFLQYKLLGTSNWQDAIIGSLDGAPYSAANKVLAQPTGSDHVLAWNASTVFTNAGPTNLWLRVCAQDMALVGDWSAPMPYSLSVKPDTDGDGLPDDWERQNFGTLAYGPNDDPDHDGMNNLAECRAGTNPNDPNSKLALTLRVVGTNAIVTWQSGTNATQYLQRRILLDAGLVWQDIFTNPAPTPTSGSYTNQCGTNNMQFYRILLGI